MEGKWLIEFNEKGWEAIKQTIANGDFINGNDYFGCLKRNALCVDIVLRDIGDNEKPEFLLCADGYALGVDSGYGYAMDNTPYDDVDGPCLKYDTHQTYEAALKNFIEQLDAYIKTDSQWKEAANRTDFVWKEGM